MSNMARVPLRQAQQNRYLQRARLPFRCALRRCPLTPLHHALLIAGRALLLWVGADCWGKQPGLEGEPPVAAWLPPKLFAAFDVFSLPEFLTIEENHQETC